ncbi:MAG: transglycosylase domain-containing protein [Tissierellia bacterium]|nr:transglycosylase domain-containing protein [Tissierellia bacterium]
MKNNQRNKSRGIIKISGVLKILLLLILIAIIIVSTIGATLLLGIFKDAPVIDPKNYRNQLAETSRIYSDDNTLIHTLVQNEFSEYVPLKNIPKDLQDAIVSIEDVRFYEHNAVDFRRVASALAYDIKTRSFAQGASTITMQLAKNLYTSSLKSVERKITDVYYAYQIESKLTKDEILEAYLNSVGFSKGTVGVQAASKTFFNKDVSDLNLAECALLAGVTNRPEEFTPYNTAYLTEDDDLENSEIVLIPKQGNSEPNSDFIISASEKLVELGILDRYDLIQIKANEVIPMKAVFNERSKDRQKKILGKMLKQGKINQSQYETALNTPINIDIGKRNEEGMSSFYTELVQEEVEHILMDLGYSAEEAQTKVFNGGFKIYTPMNVDIQRQLDETVSNPKLYYGNFVDDKGVVQPQISSVIIDHHTGEVKALNGGRGVSGGRLLNRATVPRQPGSSIKPISVYLTAFNNGATAGDVYLDAPIPNRVFPNAPKNVGHSYQGWTTIRNLLRRSSNVGALLVARDISVDKDARANKNKTYSTGYDDDVATQKIIDTLQSIGVTSIVTTEEDPVKHIKNPKTNDQAYSPLALGGMTWGISPLEMAGAYTTLANEGVYQKPIFVTKIENSSGEVIYEADFEGKEITSKQNAYILTDLLEDVVQRGTGRNANFPRMHVAGKTGTTDNKKDVWFVGYTPYYTCSVWIGTDHNDSLRFGSDRAAYVWKEIMRPIHQDLEDKDFEEPEGIYTKYVNGRRELFAEGTTPHFINKLGWRSSQSTKKKKEEKKEEKKNDNQQESKKNDNNNSSNSSKNKNNND